jgi:hypothetical protein
VVFLGIEANSLNIETLFVLIIVLLIFNLHDDKGAAD